MLGTVDWSRFWILNDQSLGENSRWYHGFKSEGFVGRISDLAVACSKNYLEQMVLPRFFMGLLAFLWICFCFFNLGVATEIRPHSYVCFFFNHSSHFHPLINDLSWQLRLHQYACGWNLPPMASNRDHQGKSGCWIWGKLVPRGSPKIPPNERPFSEWTWGRSVPMMGFQSRSILRMYSGLLGVMFYNFYSFLRDVLGCSVVFLDVFLFIYVFFVILAPTLL